MAPYPGPSLGLPRPGQDRLLPVLSSHHPPGPATVWGDCCHRPRVTDVNAGSDGAGTAWWSGAVMALSPSPAAPTGCSQAFRRGPGHCPLREPALWGLHGPGAWPASLSGAGQGPRLEGVWRLSLSRADWIEVCAHAPVCVCACVCRHVRVQWGRGGLVPQVQIPRS